MGDGVFISVFVQLAVSSRCGVVDHVPYSWNWPPCGYATTQSCTSDTNFWWTLAPLLLPSRHGVVAAKHALPRQSCSDLHSGPLSCAPLFCMQVNDPTVQYMPWCSPCMGSRRRLHFVARVGLGLSVSLEADVVCCWV